MQPLNPLEISLNGSHLIEASAGTGKTHTITILVLRLVLEARLPINKILVVTFTDAATAELRARIRRSLMEGLIAFESGHSDNEVLQVLLSKYPTPENKEEALNYLRLAINGFDEAAIFTIHAFCRRMLQDNAFESGSLFDTELIKQQDALLMQIIEDFWRKFIYNSNILFISYLYQVGYKQPKDLLSIIGDGKFIGQKFLRLVPDTVKLEPAAVYEQEFSQKFIAASTCWQEQQAEIKNLLLDSTNGLNKQSYSQNRLQILFAQLDMDFAADWPNFASDAIDKLRINNLKVNKGKTVPQHRFFILLEELYEAQTKLIGENGIYTQYLLNLKLDLFVYVEKNLKLRKMQHKLQFFDDLLIYMYDGLHGDYGEQLAASIRRKYSAALIDEFQDTDPVQYHIFQRIYDDQQEVRLFFIGDPKQAIYSFRGADIFAYIEAYNQVKQRHTLDTNWRSDARLIQAINHLFSFSRLDKPFMFAEIPFHAVQAPKNRSEVEILFLHGEQQAPLQFYLIKRSDFDLDIKKVISKEKAKILIPQLVADKIANLLNLALNGQAVLKIISDKIISQRPVEAGDIAILVRKNTQAIELQQALRKYNIPSVIYSRDSLFATLEILEIYYIISALASPFDESLFKSALVTKFFGFNANKLQVLINNEQQYSTYLKRWHYYHFLWHNYGFIQMFRSLLRQEQVASKILQLVDGERRLTNILHAGEVLQQASIQYKLGINGLVRWLGQQLLNRNLDVNSEDETLQLRLESDEKRVKIITVHKSKGLEYPIVFCPYLWDGGLSKKQKNKAILLHDNDGNPLLDIGSQQYQENNKQTEYEQLAENLRLFYVAVTRAKHRCYLFWGNFNTAETSPLAHLLHFSNDGNKSDKSSEFKKLSDAELEKTLLNLVNSAEGSIAYENIKFGHENYARPVEPEIKLYPRYFTAKINTNWQIASFTALTASNNLTHNPTYADKDSYETTKLVALELDSEPSIFDFPRGATAGIFLHYLFEKLDFTLDQELLNKKLTYYITDSGYEVEKWQAILFKFIQDVLHTPLNNQNLCLSHIPKHKRLDELEFYYPLQLIRSEELYALFSQYYDLSPQQFNFSPVQGLLKGYIDAVFEFSGKYYIIDYKTHFLGQQAIDYAEEKLTKIVQETHYLLQYHLYSVALHRYLSLRLANYDYHTDFGGVFYLFVRGMRPEWQHKSGIFFHKPDAILIERLSRLFAHV